MPLAVRSTSAVTLAIATCLFACGCSKASQEKETAEYYPGTAAKENAPESDLKQVGMAFHDAPQSSDVSADSAKTGSGTASKQTIQRKIVYRGNIDLIVEDLDAVGKRLDALIKEHKGFVSGSEIRGSAGSQRQGVWTVRIPVEGFDAFRTAVLDLGIPERDSLTSEDVTDEFFDVRTRIANAQKEERRLLELLKVETKDLKDILAVEKEIARVRETIERMQGRIQVLQNLTSLSTVTITLIERKNYVPPQAVTFSTRISQTFSASVDALADFGRGCVIFAVAITPWLPLILALFGFIWWRTRRLRRQREERLTSAS